MPKTNFKIVLVAGRAQSGKDTLAQRFVDSHGFLRVGFADYPKDLCADLLDKMGCKIERWYLDDPKMKEQLIVDLDGDIFLFSTGILKEYSLTYRQFLRKVLVECGRDRIHNTIWTHAVKSYISKVLNTGTYNGVVIPDFRFENENEELERYAIRYGGLIELTTVQVVRPGNQSFDHNDLVNFKFTIGVNNDGTIADLFAKADRIATGQWKHDKYMAEVKQRAETSFLSKYQNKEAGQTKDKPDEHGIIQQDS